MTLTLETRQAQRLVNGRPGTAGKPAIIGLFGFANLLRPIWHGARADDPYADWWLLRVQDALDSADRVLHEVLDAVQPCLSSADAIEVAPSASVRPVRTSLRFSNPYAYRGAYLVAAYDRLVCAVLSGQHIGVVTRGEAEAALGLGGRPLRRAFLSPIGYRLTGITRADVVQGNARHAQAQASMGELPQEVLQGERRALHAPARPLPISRAAQHLALQPLPART